MKKIILFLVLSLSTFSFSQSDSLVAKRIYILDSLNKERIQEENKKVTIYKQNIVKKYGIYHGGLILTGKICVGMSKEAVIESWGRPSATYKITTQLGMYEQWFYSMKPNYGLGAYLYFENNHLNTISH